MPEGGSTGPRPAPTRSTAPAGSPPARREGGPPPIGSGLIDRPALERIIQRAAELQASEREIGEGLTESEVFDLGTEVGIAGRYLRQALLEERVRGEGRTVSGLGAWLLGPDAIEAQRVVAGETDAVARVLDAWMRTEEGLATLRNTQGHLRWERQPGFFAEMRRSFGAGGRAYVLARADDVAAYVQQLEPGFSHVRLRAAVQSRRAGRITGAATLAAAGGLTTAVATVLGFAAVVAVAPAVAGLAIGLPLLRRHRPDNARLHVALEGVLDRLEAGTIKPQHRQAGRDASGDLFERIGGEIRKLFVPNRTHEGR